MTDRRRSVFDDDAPSYREVFSFQIDKVVRAPAYVAAYATPAAPPPIDANTGMCFPLTEGSGTTVHDTTINAWPATLSSAAIWVP